MVSVDLNKYEKKEKIGKGGFGSVYKAIEKETGCVFAVKVSRYSLDQCFTEDIITNLSREVEIISQLNYPSVLKYIFLDTNHHQGKLEILAYQKFYHQILKKINNLNLDSKEHMPIVHPKLSLEILTLFLEIFTLLE